MIRHIFSFADIKFSYSRFSLYKDDKDCIYYTWYKKITLLLTLYTMFNITIGIYCRADKHFYEYSVVLLWYLFTLVFGIAITKVDKNLQSIQTYNCRNQFWWMKLSSLKARYNGKWSLKEIISDGDNLKWFFFRWFRKFN